MDNMRLVDVGFIASQNGSVSNKLGVLGMLVKNIYLMDGGTVVDQMQDLPQFLQFKNQNTPNDKNISVNSKLFGSITAQIQWLAKIRLQSSSSKSALAEKAHLDERRR